MKKILITIIMGLTLSSSPATATTVDELVQLAAKVDKAYTIANEAERKYILDLHFPKKAEKGITLEQRAADRDTAIRKFEAILRIFLKKYQSVDPSVHESEPQSVTDCYNNGVRYEKEKEKELQKKKRGLPIVPFAPDEVNDAILGRIPI